MCHLTLIQKFKVIENKFLDRQYMSFYMSVMMNEALSLNVMEILSFENFQNTPFLVIYAPFSQMKFFFKYPCSMHWPRVESMLFDNFKLQYAIVTTCKWLIFENF